MAADGASKKRPIVSVDLDYWRRDAALRALGEKLESTRSQILSLDFFDTLVCRLCTRPTDLFTEVGHRLIEQGCVSNRYTPLQFKMIRVQAEMRARQHAFWHKGNTEIGLSDIYAQFPEKMIHSINQAARQEVTVEQEWCFINPFVESLLHFAVSKGHRVCILSDMYLSSVNLQEIARCNGLDISKVSFWMVSNEVCTSKHAGHMFRHALKQLFVSPDNMHHLGDNMSADVEGAIAAGVNGYHYPVGDENTEYLAVAESKINTSIDKSASLFHVRRLAKKLSTEDLRDFQVAGTTLLGPALAHYSDWCVTQFKRHNIDVVFPMMREGRLIGEMIQRSADMAKLPLDITLLYVSRQSTHPGAIGEASLDTIPSRLYPRTVSETLASFGIDAAVVGFPEEIASKPINSIEMLSTIVRFLTRGQIKSVIDAFSRQKRAEFMGYFSPLLQGRKRFALLDLGWGGTIQRNITRMLALEHKSCHCHGFYLATKDSAHLVQTKDSSINGYLADFGDAAAFTDTLIRSPEMLEQTISAAVGSTTGYQLGSNGVMHPIQDDIHYDSDELKKKEAVQQGIHTYQQFWLKIADRKQLFSMDNSRLFAEIANDCRGILHRMIAYPLAQEAKTLGHFHHDDGLFSERTAPLERASARAHMQEKGYSDMYRNVAPFWPQASLAISDEALLRYMALGTDNAGHLGNLGQIAAPQRCHPSLPAKAIQDCRIDTKDWSLFHFDIRCPRCNAAIEVDIAGTLLVHKPVGCDVCDHLFIMDFDEMWKWFEVHTPTLASDSVHRYTQKIQEHRTPYISAIHRTDADSPPLLAVLSNEYCVGSICKLLNHVTRDSL